MPRPSRTPPLLAVAALVSVLASTGSAQTLELRPGDHVALIGNTLADRMQHEGSFEAMLQVRFPRHHLVIRDLGFSGDEVDVRLRSADFGTPDEWLTKVQADVVLAFFGSNEAGAGRAGAEAFRGKLDGMVKHLLAGRYNGKSAPRVVLFSPIAREGAKGRDLPDDAADNENRRLYAEITGEVAKANGVGFLDLFPISRKIYSGGDGPFTINGIHLNDLGNRRLAEAVEVALVGSSRVGAYEAVRRAVLDKNFAWFNRYRRSTAIRSSAAGPT